MREFLEEVLVCSDDEHSPILTFTKHPFYFDRLNLRDEVNYANRLSVKHEKLRFERDHIQFFEGNPIGVSVVPTTGRLRIFHGGKYKDEIRDVLVVFNITELGIEVVKILQFSIGDNDFILDGEILNPYGDEHIELIRAPVGLISIDYLRTAFKDMIDYSFTYEFDKYLPSIEAPSIPSMDIHLFKRDLEKRLEIVESKYSDTGSYKKPTEWEKNRYTRWYKTFGKHFFDSNNEVTCNIASRLFTPTVAKVLTYYFAYAKD